MGSILRFLFFAAVLIAALLFVAVPLVSGPLASALVRNSGVVGQNVNVSVDLAGTAILSGRAPSVHVQAADVPVPHGVVGDLDLTLKNVSVSDHSFSDVSGTLQDLQLMAPNGIPIQVDSVTLEGPSNDTDAHGTISAANADKLVQAVAATAGVQIDQVQLGNGVLSVRSGGTTTKAHLRVAGRALLLDRDGQESTVLVAPAPSEDWQFDSVSVTPAGIQVELDVDAQALADKLAANNSATGGAPATP